MSFFSKARGMWGVVAAAVVAAFDYQRPDRTDIGRFTDVNWKPPTRTRSRIAGRARPIATNGARLTVRYPANGSRP